MPGYDPPSWDELSPEEKYEDGGVAYRRSQALSLLPDPRKYGPATDVSHEEQDTNVHDYDPAYHDDRPQQTSVADREADLAAARWEDHYWGHGL